MWLPRPNLDRQKAIRILMSIALGIATAAGFSCIVRYIAVPILTFFAPSLETSFYDLALYGTYRTQSYHSFNLRSPKASIVQWDDTCDDGYVFIDLSGPAVDHRGPAILDARGELVWTADSFETTTNTKVQRYGEQDFLTFWSGQKAKTSGQGAYYMLDQNYTVVHRIDAAGPNAHGDLHEFKLTSEGTALLTVYNTTTADLTGMGMGRGKDGWITDSVFQEVDLATGKLLFEWKASEHFRAADGYMTNPFGGYSESIPFDFFHINSIEKDSNGDYLISSRHFHAIMGINGTDGEVMWMLGGHADDFDDLSDGAASDFSWQHDARWISEEDGLLSLFDNGMAWPHVNADYSSGRIIHVDIENRTATLVQSYVSLQQARSSSQGSVQLIPSEGGDHVFTGWGSSAVYTEHAMDGTLLCETHFAASWSFWWERVKSYRAFKVQEWDATPAAWDPSAVIERGVLYVSWNGATTVRSWELQGSKAEDSDDFDAVDIQEKTQFEEAFVLPTAGEQYVRYRVAALDADKSVLRYSNVAVKIPGGVSWFAWATLVTMVFVGAAGGVWLYRRKGTGTWFKEPSSIDRSKYRKLW